jgi:hypothetical protein
VTEALAILARIEADLATLRRLLDAPEEREPEPEPEQWLTPGQLAGRLGIGERYVTKLLARGLSAGHPGVRKPAGRWKATIAAVHDLRPD